MHHGDLQHETRHERKNRRAQHGAPQNAPRKGKGLLFIASFLLGTQGKTAPRTPRRSREEQRAQGDVQKSRGRHGEKIHDQTGQVRNHSEQIHRPEGERRREANPQDAEKRAAHAKGAAAQGKPRQHSLERQQARKLHEHAQDDEPQHSRNARCGDAGRSGKISPSIRKGRACIHRHARDNNRNEKKRGRNPRVETARGKKRRRLERHVPEGEIQRIAAEQQALTRREARA